MRNLNTEIQNKYQKFKDYKWSSVYTKKHPFFLTQNLDIDLPQAKKQVSESDEKSF